MHCSQLHDRFSLVDPHRSPLRAHAAAGSSIVDVLLTCSDVLLQTILVGWDQNMPLGDSYTPLDAARARTR